MFILIKKNYGVFTNIIVLQESRVKEAKRTRKVVEKTKARNRICRDISTNFVTQQKEKEMSQHFKCCHDSYERSP